jgi:hypothetical protein
MGDWIYRPDLQEDWMSLVFLLNFMVVMILNKLDSGRLKSLLNIFKPRIYFSKYSHDKELNFFTYFNLLCFVLIISALSLTYFSLSIYSKRPLEFSFEFYYLLLGMGIVLFFKHLLFQIISVNLGFNKYIRLIVYKNFTFATQASFFLVVIIFLWNYSSLPTIISEALILLLLGFWLANQFSLFFSFFKSHSRELIYIILYLCTFKIAPWIWVYLVFIETEL